jgi:hypothetical protein
MTPQALAIADILPAVHAAAVDADTCKASMLANDSPFARRMWVRAYFAWVEVVCFSARQYVLERRFNKRVIRPADIPEFLALSELRYNVTGGKIVAERLRSRTRDQLAFSLLVLAEFFGLRLTIDRSGRSWNAVQGALNVRDRITHPKTSREFDVSDNDIKTVNEFSGWFAGHLHVIFDDRVRARIKREAARSKRSRTARVLTIDMDAVS